MTAQIASNPEKILTPTRAGMEGSDAGTGPLAERVELVKERARDLYQKTRERAVEMEDEFEGYVREHPVKSIAIASAVGAGIGLLVGVLASRR
jgi:ElaB/YqjD/DUF883 family membrane-anchored ribosome-binding protein